MEEYHIILGIIDGVTVDVGSVRANDTNNLRKNLYNKYLAGFKKYHGQIIDCV